MDKTEPSANGTLNEDFTFDRSGRNQRTNAFVVDTFDHEFDIVPSPSNARFNDKAMLTAVIDTFGTGWCRKCSASAKMSGSDPKLWEKSGVCDTRGCPGYMGHPPASRPQGYDHDETSDDVPLLFSPLSSSSISHSSHELDMVDHCHGLEPTRDASLLARKQLGLATILCTVFVVGEVVGGYYSSSLAILGDAAHMFSDLASFGISLFVLWLSNKKPKKTMTYGYQRAEALGALATLCIIWYVTGILVYLAVRRIHDQDFEIHDNYMIMVASAAVIFNVLLGITLHGVCKIPHAHSHGGHHGHSHGDNEDGSSNARHHINIRAALIHVLGDLLQSIGVLFSSLLIKFFGDDFKIADPICTLIFAGIVVVTTFNVLKDTLTILLEGTPSNIDYDSVYHDLQNIKEVYKVHSLHIWSLTADLPVLSVHIASSPAADMEQIRAEANKMLRKKYKIYRTTLQVEHYNAQAMGSCEKCQPLSR